MLPVLAIAALLLIPPMPVEETGRPFKIIQVSDTHVGRHAPAEDGARLHAFLGQLAAQEAAVDLWAFTGDLTHKGLPSQLEAFKDALGALPAGAQVVLVKGNHDEGRPEVKGEAYEAVLGDPTRSFEARGFRIVTAPQLTDEGEDGAWLMETLRAARRPVLLFVHYYPRAEWLDPVRDTRLRAIFSGHWHGNQAVRSGDVYSFNTASATLGGWDFSPPVARVVEIDGDQVRSRLVPRAPRESAVAWAFEDRLLVQVVTAAGIRDEMRCTAGDESWVLQRKGLYAWEALTKTVATGEALSCTSGSWASKPPLHDAASAGIRWARPLGRMQYGGGPALAGDRAVVATRTGLVEDHGGAVHALDLDTGALLWRRDLSGHPGGSPATDGQRAYVQTLDGALHALDLATGRTTWSFRLADLFPPMFVTHWVGTGPSIRDGRLYTCYQKGPYVVDAARGTLLDREEAIDGYDVLGVTPARIAGARLFCGTFTEGLFSWVIDAQGALTAGWKDTSVRVTAAPAMDRKGRLWVRTLEDLRAYDPETGATPRGTRLSWLQVPSAPLPLAESVVTTGRMGRPAALETDGAVTWTRTLGRPLATFELNRHDHPAPLASPIRTPEGVVIAGPDGVLQVIDAANGAPLRRWSLGAPLASTPAAAGSRVVVVDLGGTAWCIDTFLE
jgi:outer membrane protein assembly factor BamB/predicted phosphodiesterase